MLFNTTLDPAESLQLEVSSYRRLVQRQKDLRGTKQLTAEHDGFPNNPTITWAVGSIQPNKSIT